MGNGPGVESPAARNFPSLSFCITLTPALFASPAATTPDSEAAEIKIPVISRKKIFGKEKFILSISKKIRGKVYNPF